LTRPFHDLYMHGEHLNAVCKKAFSEFKRAEKEGNESMMIAWGECLRKVTMNCVDVAKTVLGVEEIVKRV